MDMIELDLGELIGGGSQGWRKQMEERLVIGKIKEKFSCQGLDFLVRERGWIRNRQLGFTFRIRFFFWLFIYLFFNVFSLDQILLYIG